MEPTTLVNKSARCLLLFLYLFFCWLMLGIIFPYTDFSTDSAFLGIKQQYIDIPFYLTAFYIHVFTAGLALPAGATQFSKSFLKQYPQWHRLNGRIYAYSILLLAAPSGLYIGFFANGGLSSRIAFILLGLLWIFTTLQATRAAMQKKMKLHRAFVYRSFALTFSAITLRAWKWGLVALFHPRPMDVYQWVAWLGWVPNLVIAEYLIRKNKSL